MADFSRFIVFSHIALLSAIRLFCKTLLISPETNGHKTKYHEKVFKNTAILSLLFATTAAMAKERESENLKTELAF
ncbi:MAG: hypothetical protein WBG48_15300 [Pricia sp.]